MKARIICNGLNDLRDKVQELCKPSEVKRVYLPENEESNNHYGIAYAVDSKNNVIAATPIGRQMTANMNCKQNSPVFHNCIFVVDV